MSEPTATPPAPAPAAPTGPMGMEPADFISRAIAIIIDWVILIIISAILGLIPLIGWLLGMVVPILYCIYFWTMENPVGEIGQTPGKKVMNIKVVMDDGSNLDVVKAIIRMVGYFISTIIIFIGYLFPLWREDKKALHDLIANTIVVKVQ